MMPNAKFNNLISRVLLKRLFDHQWIIPKKLSLTTRAALSLIENYIVKAKYDSIKIDRPIFIISLPRSGSSMLQDLLCTHRDAAYINNIMHIFSPHYCGAEYIRKQLKLDVVGERFLRDSVMVNATSPSDPVGVWNRWYSLDPELLDFEDLGPDNSGDLDVKGITDEIKRIIWCFHPLGDGRFILKNPGLMPYLDLTNHLFTDARFIYLVRDPRQNANSMLKLYNLCEEQRQLLPWQAPYIIPYPHLPGVKEAVETYGPDNLSTTATVWNCAANFMENWEPRDNVHLVRYEDILHAPKETIDLILEFCQLDPSGANNEAFSNKFSSIGVTNHRNPAYTGFDIIEDICHSQMSRLGYI